MLLEQGYPIVSWLVNSRSGKWAGLGGLLVFKGQTAKSAQQYLTYGDASVIGL